MAESKSARIAAAREEFQADLKDNKGDGSDPKPDRFIQSRAKSSSSNNTVTCGITIRDQSIDKAKYVVSVSTVMIGDNASEDVLNELQSRITEFLKTIHDGL